MPKGHEKEQSKTLTTVSNDQQKKERDVSNVLAILDAYQVRTSPFGANVSGENSYRRAERISAALHLLTSHVPETEPLRGIIRSRGINLLEHMLDMRTGFRTPTSEQGQAVLAAIRELVSLVRLLAVSGYVSPQNAGAMIAALDELGTLIVIAQRSTLSEQVNISREMLVPFSAPIPDRSRTPPRTVKDKISPKGTDDSAVRTEQIMDILKAGGTLGIKDIASNLPKYSEKMVQRELAVLVASNRVRKIGDKRWSKYEAIS